MPVKSRLQVITSEVSAASSLAGASSCSIICAAPRLPSTAHRLRGMGAGVVPP